MENETLLDLNHEYGCKYVTCIIKFMGENKRVESL